jgi:2-haloacid dehalogenase
MGGGGVQICGMSRRDFLRLMGGVAFSGCGPHRAPAAVKAPSASRPGIAAVAFDLFTLFDPRGVDARVAEVVGDRPDVAASWKSKLFEYSWLRAASGQYRDFRGLVHDALVYATRRHGIELSGPAFTRLEASFTELAPWPDSKATLAGLRQRGLRLVTLANYAPVMVEALVKRGGLADDFDDLISTDRAQTFKPDPRAYALGESALRLPRQQIAFAAFGSWDAAGARWFGFPTFWVNRLSQPNEELIPPNAQGPDLVHLERWLAEGGPS